MAGIEKVPIRVPREWERALPGFEKWFTQFVRDVLAKGDVRNAIAEGGIVITGDPGSVATVGSDGFGGNAIFAPRHISFPDDQSHRVDELRALLPRITPAPVDQGSVLGEVRAFVRDPQTPVEFADAQTILAHRIFGG